MKFLLPLIRGSFLAGAFVILPLPALGQEACVAGTPDCPPAQEADPAPANAWTVSEVSSPFSLAPATVASVSSEETVAGMFGTEAPVALVIQCDQNSTSVFLDFEDVFVSDVDTYGQVTFRVDQRVPRIASFTAADDNSSLGLFGGATAIPLIRELFNAESMNVRLRTFTNDDVDLTFDINGLAEAITPIRQMCNW